MLKHRTPSRSMVWSGSNKVCSSRCQVLHSRLHKLTKGAESSSSNADTALQELSIEIPTTDARSCIRFKVVPTGPAQQAIVVEAVADGSSAAQAGVQRGMKLTAISDPVRRNEVWQLQDRPSIRYIRDVLRMRSSPFIELQFRAPTADLLVAMEAADDSLQLTSTDTDSDAPSSSSWAGVPDSSDTAESIASLTSLSSSDESSGSTMAERMQARYEQKQQASSGVVAFKQRQQRRQEYMAQVGQRKDSNFALILGAAFLLPALLILGIAYGTGYLDSLYSNTMTNMR